jgi:hypothetical protein
LLSFSVDSPPRLTDLYLRAQVQMTASFLTAS